MGFGQQAESTLNSSSSCLLKSYSSYLTSSPEDTLSLEDVAAENPAVVRALDVLRAAKEADYRVVQTVDVVLGIYPSDRTSSFRRDHTAGAA